MPEIANVFTPGHLDPADSYGLIACQLVSHLARLGVHVNAIPLGDRQMDTQPADVDMIAGRPITPAFGGFLLGYPTSYDAYGALATAGPRVAVTMFESTQIPPAWVPILNTLDAVIVPSQFCLGVFQQCGVEAPIYAVPLGVGEVYQPAARKRTAADPFTFLAFADRGIRKGWHHAVQAFIKAFGDDMNYRLVLKGREGFMGFTNPNIQVIYQDMTEQELYELYLSADCLINANLGEGFGLIPREFAATGGLALATNWGGTAEDIEHWGLPIDYELVPAWGDDHKHKGLGLWAWPDIGELATLLEVVAESRDSWQPKCLERASKLHDMYSWERFVETAYRLWAGYIPVRPLAVLEYA
jgi:glycosyltransferase involved in cell wall biosynthesis